MPSPAPHATPLDDLIHEHDTDVERGLEATTAAVRLERDGPNVLEGERPVPLWRRILEQFNDPLIYLLLAAIAISLAAWIAEGAHGAPVDAIVISAIVVMNAVIGLVQEGKAAQAVAALQDMTAPESTVVRDGETTRIPSSQIVEGDVLVLEEGDQVAADGRLASATNLLVGEASLTGESVPVEKTVGAVPADTPLAERTAMVYSGTAVAQGIGRAIVTSTGMRTEMGAIAGLLHEAKPDATPLEREIGFVSRTLTIAVIVIALVVMVTVYLVTADHSAASLVTILLLGVSLAVAAVPEGLPAILSLVLALGVQRMAKRNAIVTQLSSVETLGSASVICTDKTGTLTRNEMTIERVATPDRTFDLDDLAAQAELESRDWSAGPDAMVAMDPHVRAAHQALDVLALGTVANNARVTFGGARPDVLGDPTEASFHLAERALDDDVDEVLRAVEAIEATAATAATAATEATEATEATDDQAGPGRAPGSIPAVGGAAEPGVHDDSAAAARRSTVRAAFLRARNAVRVREVPFSSDRKLMSVVVEEPTMQRDAGAREAAASAGDAPRMLVAKGAPDVLLDRCTRVRTVDGDIDLTRELRDAVLAQVRDLSDAAYRTLGVALRPVDDAGLLGAADDELERDATWVGLVGIVDPPRAEVAEAIAECHGAGIRVVMITGDHPRTAARIAASLGIVRDASGMTGASGVTGASGRPWPPALTGRELDELTDDEFDEAVRNVAVYARVAPKHKLAIVERLQAQGNVVSMTGDGVNDAPALKQADIGVAMGITGTQVTREAANMVLADDNFTTIVRAVREGRGIFTNVSTFLRYLLSSNMGEVLTVFFGVVLAGTLGLVGPDGAVVLPLLATQILWVNLLTDSAPAIALGVDPVPDDAMRRAPRRTTDRVIDGQMWASILLIGLVMAIVSLFAIDLSLPGGLIEGSASIEVGRTMAFTVLVFAQLFNTINCRSDERSAFAGLFTNAWLGGAVLLSVALQVLVVHVPLLNVAFGTAPLSLGQWLTCLALASAVLWFDELKKLARRGIESRRWRADPQARRAVG